MMHRLAFALAAAALGLPSAVSAAPIVAGTTVIPTRAIQDVTLLPNTPFNPTDDAIVIDDLFGDGLLTLDRSGQVGTTIAIPSLSGVYFGSHPLLGDYVFGTVGVLTAADFSGTIADVVQNPNDPGFGAGDPSSFVSGTATFGGDSFGFAFLSGPAAGVVLYTDAAVPFEFTAAFDGLPPTPGTVLANSGPEVLNVLFTDPTGAQLVVGTSSDRRIVVTAAAVPEPASLALAGVAVVGLVGVRRRVG